MFDVTPERARIALTYTFAVALTALALALTWMVKPLLGRVPSAIVLADVVLVAWRAGFRPAMVAIGMSALVLAALEPTPISDLRLAEAEMFWVLVFVVVGLSLAWVTVVLNARLEREETARARAEAAVRAKDEFLAVLSHELRTPLTAMLGWIRVLRSGGMSADQVEQAIETIERNTVLQARLVGELLDVSRIIAGKLHLDIRLVSLSPVVRHAVDSLRPVAAAKGVRLDCVAEGSTPHVRGDTVRLQQVVANLVSNAIKFTPAGGAVGVRLEKEADAAQINVTDTGIGIEADLLPHVFTRFRQSDDPHGTEGLGLGLSIVQDLVALHGGTVRAYSAGRGRGASFIVALPVADPPAAGLGRAVPRLRGSSPPRANHMDGAGLEGGDDLGARGEP